MSKKFTSFLVLAAALLLTVPTHAQIFKKAAKQQVTTLKAGPLKVNDVQKVKAAKAKANDKTVGFAFTGAMLQKVAEATLLKDAVNKIEEDKISFEKLMAENMAGAHKVANSFLGGTPRPVVFNSPVASNSRRAETIDEHGIITAPAEGEVKLYTRAGAAYYYNQGWGVTTQSGHATLIECEDGTVYFKDPISRLSNETYIKGTKSGNTITFPAGQPIIYVSDYTATIDVKWGSYVSGTGFTASAEQPDIVFTIDGNTLTLEGTSSTNYVVIGGFWSDDNTMQSGDSETVLTLDTEYTPASTDPIVAPEGLVTETWNTDIDGVVSTATIGFDNNDVYVKGLFTAFPDAWIKGTIDGTTVTFSKLQYVGAYQGSVSIWATGVDEDSKLADFVMTYDAVAKVLTGSNLLLNAADDKAYYLSWFESVTIQEGSFAEPEATTGDPVDAVPYSNALSTAVEFADFGVIDSNKDGKTWGFSADDGTYYSYSGANAADDWLISPAIKLEAGKDYRVALDAANAGFPERFEVLIGAEPKASALTIQAIAPTDVTDRTFTTFENNISVSETGYYHFGIHAISDADQFRLYVNNFIVEAGAEPTAPAAVTDFAVAQTPDKLETVVSFKAPAKTVGGDDLTDLTKIEVLRDGKVIKSLGGAEPISWDASAQGYENAQDVAAIDFGGGFTATLDGGGNTNTPKYYTSGTALRMYAKNSMTLKGTAIKKVVFTFKDKNVLEANVGTLAIDGMTGTWTGNADEIVFTVTDGSGNQARIQKIEIEGAAAGLIPGAEYTYVDDAEDLTVGTHVYQVIPYNASGAGVKSEEKSIFLSVSFEVPQTFDFTQNLLDLFGVIDNNGDGKTWSWSESNGAYYPYSSSNAADDYLITMPFKLKAGKKYNVIVTAKNSGFDEKFEVLAGKEATVAGLTETVIAETTISADDEATNSTWAEYEGTFAPAEDGSYNFAIHATSDADMFNLCVKTLVVELAPEETAPAAIADFTATAGAEGALEANLAFTAPAKAINGEALTANVDVKIYRDGEVINTLTGVAPGAATTWKDETVEGGTHIYYVVAANESGDGLKSEKVSVFVGEDVAGEVENILVTGTTPTTISLKWDAVAGENGGYVNLAQMKYAVVSMHIETYWIFQYLVVDDVLGTVTGETSGTFNYPVDEGAQDWNYIGVVALQGDAVAPGAGDEYAGGYASVLVGSPYTMPFVESFTGGTLAYDIWTYGGAEDAYVTLTDDASDNDGGAVLMTTYQDPGTVQFESGKIKIEGANPTLIFDAKASGITSGKIMASVDDAEWTLVKSFDVTEDYQTVKVSLLNAKGERFTRIAFAADIVNPSEYQGQDQSTGENIFDWKDVLYIDNIKVVDLYEYNLVADIKAPKSVVAGKSAKVLATVRNEGENAATNYTVTIKANDKVLASVLADENLESFASDEISVDFETSIFDEAGDVTLTVSVEYENELLPEDNTASTIITVQEPAAVAPTSLLAEDKGKAGVDLTWIVNEGGVAEVTESFDDESVFEPFGLGGITADEHSGAFGDWTLYDGNGISTYGFNGTEFPNNYAPMAFIPFNPATVSESLASTYAPHSGDQFLISFCPAEENNAPATDHWLISPELPGIAQTVGFYARVITDQYGPETFEVWASSTDNNVNSFTKVADYSTDATEWTEFTAALPAGTKFFAIRHTSTDVFGLMIDDVKFSANTAATAASFNIYYNGEKIATVEGDKTTYTVAREKVEVGTQTFGVSAVYANGAESRVTVATIEIVTGIQQIAADGKAVDVYSLDGKLIRSQATSLDGLKGFYIVNGKKVMVK